MKLGVALKPAAHYRQGFHPTGTCGAFGAAAASARIMKLTEEESTHTLGIAGSQAAGSLEFLSDGAFTKRFHAGWAAHSGVLAAELAREGFTGPASIIEGKLGKFYSEKCFLEQGFVKDPDTSIGKLVEAKGKELGAR